MLGTGAVSRSAALPSASTSGAKPSSPSYASIHSGFSLSTGKVPLSGLMSSGIKVCRQSVASSTATQQHWSHQPPDKLTSSGKSGYMNPYIHIVFQSSSEQPPLPTAHPTHGSRPLQLISPSSLGAFSVSGRRLKSLKQPAAPTPLLPPSASHHQSLEQQRDLQPQRRLHEPLQQQRISLSSAGNRASSRLSMNGPMHWGELDIYRIKGAKAQPLF